METLKNVLPYIVLALAVWLATVFYYRQKTPVPEVTDPKDVVAPYVRVINEQSKIIQEYEKARTVEDSIQESIFIHIDSIVPVIRNATGEQYREQSKERSARFIKRIRSGN